VRGIREDGLRGLPMIANNIKSGTLDGFDKQQGIAIGVGLANVLRLRVGDSLTLVSPRGARTPFGVAPRIKAYRITAIFEMGMSEFDRGIIFMPLAEAQRFFDKGNAVDVLEVLVDDPERVENAVAAMQNLDIPRCRSSATPCSSFC
jgi:lipoprotein-releasing system permease protein